MLGYKALGEEDRRNLADAPAPEGRQLQAFANIDWTASNMTPVKD